MAVKLSQKFGTKHNNKGKSSKITDLLPVTFKHMVGNYEYNTA